MKAKYISMIWGLALIIAGGIFLAENLGYVPHLANQVWVFVFAGLSLLFFASYFFAGLRQWGWLFPATITAGLAITIELGILGFTQSFVGAPVLAGITVPFLVAFLVDTRKNWWALIPTWVMGMVTVVTLVADVVRGEVIGTLVLFSIAAPFVLVYLLDRTKKWALIPAFVLVAVGVIPLLSMFASGEWIGAFVMFAIAIPFFVVYFWSQQNWWALIPAGGMSTIGVVVLLSGVERPNLLPGIFTSTLQSSLIGFVMFAGWALTFFILWLQRAKNPTDWAKYPAIALALVGVFSLAVGVASIKYVWPLLIIVLGVLVLYGTMRRRSA